MRHRKLKNVLPTSFFYLYFVIYQLFHGKSYFNVKFERLPSGYSIFLM